MDASVTVRCPTRSASLIESDMFSSPVADLSRGLEAYLARSAPAQGGEFSASGGLRGGLAGMCVRSETPWAFIFTDSTHVCVGRHRSECVPPNVEVLWQETPNSGECVDFEQLRIFMVLAEERTFLGAANRLATSRSRVRRKLDQLEADAGTPLVKREQTGLVLTAAGNALVRRGRALLEEAEHLISHVRDVGTEAMGRLSIAMSPASSPVGWDELCRKAQQRHPRLQLDFVYAEDPAALLPARAELALTFDEVEIPGTRVIHLGEHALRLVASEHYIERRGAPVDASQLSEHDLAVWRVPGRSIDSLPLRDGREQAIAPRLISDDPLHIHRAVAAGDCIGYLPVLPQLNDPALKSLLSDQVVGAIRPRLIVPNILSDVPRVDRFLAVAAEVVNSSTA